MKDKKFTGDDDVPGGVFTLLGEDGLRIMATLFKNVYEAGEWHHDFTEVTVTVFMKKQKAAISSDNRTISLIAYTAKCVARILRRIETKVEDVLGEERFGFGRWKGAGDAVGMLRIISEQALDMKEELLACFIDRQKEFDRVN